MDIDDLPPELSEAAVALWAQAGLTRPWNDPHADLARALAGPASTVLCGRSEGRLLATVMVGHDGHRGWVYYLAVQPGAQRHGLGREMMAAAEAWLTQRAIPKLQLMVRDDNESARGFYEAIGYAHDAVTVFSRRLPG